MEPEIARRCQTCGAAVRGTARFCPQCGQTMADERGDAATPAQPRAKSALVDQAERVANSLSGRLAAREAEATAPADEVEDVLSLGEGPVVNAHVEESFATPRDQGPVASARAEGPVARASEPAIENSPTADDGARASVETSRADERGARPVERGAQSVSTQDARADSAPITEGALEESARVAGAESAGDARGAGRVRRRAAAVGAGLGGSVRPRVEKLRDASVVVFDEAAEDPGMRFVVIAALLFVVALLILLFSFVLR
jgi:hypothetical protein